MTAAIDAHAHIWTTAASASTAATHEVPPVDLEADLETLQSQIDAAGIERVLLIQPSHRGQDHAYVLDAAKGHGPRFRVVVLGLPTGDRVIAELDRLCDEPAVAAIRLTPLRAPDLDWFGAGADGLWKLARARGIAICVLASPSQLSYLLSAVRRFADVPVVIDHLGRPDLGPAATWLGVIREIATLPNVRIKISALSAIGAGPFPFQGSWDWVKQVVQQVGPERLLWGSDFPYLGAARSLLEARSAVPQCLEAAGLSPDEVMRVMCGNASGLFWKGASPEERRA